MRLLNHLFGSLKPFLIAMSGKHPSTIFIDQDATMVGEIAMVSSTKQSMIMSISKFKTTPKISGLV
jgi:hypothetical protein